MTVAGVTAYSHDVHRLCHVLVLLFSGHVMVTRLVLGYIDNNIQLIQTRRWLYNAVTQMLCGLHTEQNVGTQVITDVNLHLCQLLCQVLNIQVYNSLKRFLREFVKFFNRIFIQVLNVSQAYIKVPDSNIRVLFVFYILW